jgi:hypothetical protein
MMWMEMLPETLVYFDHLMWLMAKRILLNDDIKPTMMTWPC